MKAQPPRLPRTSRVGPPLTASSRSGASPRHPPAPAAHGPGSIRNPQSPIPNPPAPAPRQDPDYMRHPAFAKEIRDKREQELRRGLMAPFRSRFLWLQLGLFALVLLLWRVPIVNPIKVLVVLFHEMSHVAMAYLTGGVVIGMAIDPGGAGVTLGIGGNDALILMAGYAGSLAIGLTLYALSAVWKPGEVWLCLCLLCFSSIFYGWLNEFTRAFGFGAILILLVGAVLFSPGVKQFFLRWIATTSCLYPILDLAGEYIRSASQGFVVKGRVAGSDVAQLSAMLDIPRAFLAITWGILGALAVIWMVSWAADKDAESRVRRSVLDPWRRARETARSRIFTDALYDPNDPSTIRVYRLR